MSFKDNCLRVSKSLSGQYLDEFYFDNDFKIYKMVQNYTSVWAEGIESVGVKKLEKIDFQKIVVPTEYDQILTEEDYKNFIYSFAL